MGSGGGGSTTYSKAITWQKLLPPWVQKGQQEFLPYLFQRVYAGGMTPEEEAFLRGTARSEVNSAVDASKRALAQRMAASGLTPSSGVFMGGFGGIEAGRAPAMADALAQLYKTKMGAGESARQQLLTALYTPPPYAIASYGSSSPGGK